MNKRILSHRDLAVYRTARQAALSVSALVKQIPPAEVKLTEQARRAARSPGASISEAWRKRRYQALWISKLSDAEGEAAEVQWWLDIILGEGYCTEAEFQERFDLFEKLIAQLVTMATQPEKWVTPEKTKKRDRPSSRD